EVCGSSLRPSAAGETRRRVTSERAPYGHASEAEVTGAGGRDEAEVFDGTACDRVVHVDRRISMRMLTGAGNDERGDGRPESKRESAQEIHQGFGHHPSLLLLGNSSASARQAREHGVCQPGRTVRRAAPTSCNSRVPRGFEAPLSCTPPFGRISVPRMGETT